MNVEIDDRNQIHSGNINELPETGPYKISVRNQNYQLNEFKNFLKLNEIDIDNVEITEREKTWKDGGVTYSFFVIFQARDDAIKLLEANGGEWYGSIVKPHYVPQSERYNNYNDAAERQQVHFNRNQIGANLQTGNEGGENSAPLFQRGVAIEEPSRSAMFQRGGDVNDNKNAFSRYARGSELQKDDNKPKFERGTNLNNKQMFVRNGDVKPERKRFSRGDDEQKDEELVTIRFKRGG